MLFLSSNQQLILKANYLGPRTSSGQTFRPAIILKHTKKIEWQIARNIWQDYQANGLAEILTNNSPCTADRCGIC